MWGGVLATDKQLEAEKDKVALEKRAQAYEGYLAAVEDLKTELGIATNFHFDASPAKDDLVINMAPEEIRAAVKGLVDLQYGLSAPQTKVRVYGSPEASVAAGHLRNELTDAIVRAVSLNLVISSKAQAMENREAIRLQLQEVSAAQADFIDIARRELP